MVHNRRVEHAGLKMSLIRLVLFILAIGLSPINVSNGQMVNPELLSRPWRSKWIACPQGPRREFGVYHFRKTFSLQSRPAHFIIHVSGDNRYELFVNGERVLAGPARGDLYHWRFETLDIASHLQAGKNVLAAVKVVKLLILSVPLMFTSSDIPKAGSLAMLPSAVPL